jgi:hypothetical protein
MLVMRIRNALRSSTAIFSHRFESDGFHIGKSTEYISLILLVFFTASAVRTESWKYNFVCLCVTAEVKRLCGDQQFGITNYGRLFF